MKEELQAKMQEKELDQSGWSIQRLHIRTMFIDKFSPIGDSYVELPFKSKDIINKKILEIGIIDDYYNV